MTPRLTQNGRHIHVCSYVYVPAKKRTMPMNLGRICIWDLYRNHEPPIKVPKRRTLADEQRRKIYDCLPSWREQFRTHFFEAIYHPIRDRLHSVALALDPQDGEEFIIASDRNETIGLSEQSGLLQSD